MKLLNSSQLKDHESVVAGLARWKAEQRGRNALAFCAAAVTVGPWSALVAAGFAQSVEALPFQGLSSGCYETTSKQSKTCLCLHHVCISLAQKLIL